MAVSKTITHNGETRTIKEWAALAGVPHKTFTTRIGTLGWPMERALAAPLVVRRRRGGRPKTGVPRQCPECKRHPSGRAYSRWKARGTVHERYFGRYGSEAAALAYRRFAAEWATGAFERTAEEKAGGASVAALALAWLAECRTTYVKDGRPTTEIHHAESAVKCLGELYGTTRAADFTPDALRACRETFVARRLTRGTVNGYTSRIVRCFRWGAARSLVPASVHAAIALVEPLASGRTAAPDRERKRPATDAQIAATLPHLAPSNPAQAAKLAAMVQIQRLTGMRPGEVCALAPNDLDRVGEVWRYEVGRANKNRHRGKRQVYWLGPKAIALLAPLLASDPAADQPAFGIGRGAYGVAVTAAAARAGCGSWSPHQLRHALATEVARAFGSLDHAAAAIGDSAAVAAAVYVHVDPRERSKIEVARAMG